MALLLLAAVVQKTVDIGLPVVEGRKEKTAHGLLHGPVCAAVQEGAGFLVVAESFLHQIHRADAAQKEGVDVVGRVLHVRLVSSLCRDIIDSVDEQDQIFALVLKVLHDLFKKLCQKIVVLEFRLQKPVKHLLTASLHLLGDGKFHVEEIAPELAGHSAAQDLAVFFQRFFLHSRQGIMQLPDHFSLFVHVTAADPADAAVGFYELSYLADRLFIHRVSSF